MIQPYFQSLYILHPAAGVERLPVAVVVVTTDLQLEVAAVAAAVTSASQV